MGKLYRRYVGDIYMDYVALSNTVRVLIEDILTTYFKPQDLSQRGIYILTQLTFGASGGLQEAKSETVD